MNFDIRILHLPSWHYLLQSLARKLREMTSLKSVKPNKHVTSGLFTSLCVFKNFAKLLSA